MKSLFYLGAFAGSAAVTCALTPLVARAATRFGVIDQPGGRKIHTVAVPRLGGVAVLMGLLVGVAIYAIVAGPETLHRMLAAKDFADLVLACVVVFTVGVFDDALDLSPTVRILVEAAAAAILMANGYVLDAIWHPFGAPIQLGPFAYPITLLWFIGVTNAFNLIDGLDGLLASIGIATMLGVFVVGYAVFMDGTPAIALALAGCLAGFLPWNWHRARIFMGDSGSLLIGFLAAAFAIKVARYHTDAGGVAIHVMVALCALPIAETFLTMARRYVSGHGMFSGDRSHIHHVLVRVKGLSVPRAVATLALLQLMFSAMAVSSRVRLGWYALVPVALLLVWVGLCVKWLNYLEFRVLLRYLAEGVVQKRRQALTSIFGLAEVGERLAEVESTEALYACLQETVEQGVFDHVAIEATGPGAEVLGEVAWSFPADGPPPVEAPSVPSVRFELPLPPGDGSYGRLLCVRHNGRQQRDLAMTDIRRYLAEPIAAVITRIHGTAETPQIRR